MKYLRGKGQGFSPHGGSLAITIIVVKWSGTNYNEVCEADAFLSENMAYCTEWEGARVRHARLHNTPKSHVCRTYDSQSRNDVHGHTAISPPI